MNFISRFFHEFIHPHCNDCAEERLISVHCNSCETLRSQLESANYEKKQLLEIILKKEQPELIVQMPENIKPIRPSHTPWSVRRQTLEQEDRERAKIIQEKRRETEEIEKEIGIAQGS